MDNSKKRGLLEISVLTVKVVMGVMLILNAFVFITYGIINRVDFGKDDPVRFIESWTVTDSAGNRITTGRDFVDEKLSNDNYSISATLPDDIRDNEYVFFYTFKDIEVYINGELRTDFVEKRDVNIPGGAIKTIYMMVPLEKADSGAGITLVRTSGVRTAQIVPETFISTRFGAFCYLMGQIGPSFLLAIVILIFSLVAFIVSLVLRFLYKLNISMTYGALGIAVIAVWIITDSLLFPIVFGMSYVNGLLNYLFCLMMPFAPAIYLNAIQKGRYKKSMSLLLLLSAANAVLWTTLHLTGVLYFYNDIVITAANNVFVLLAVITIIILIADARKGNIVEYKYTFIGFMGFAICCIIELVLILMSSTYRDSLPMVMGLGIFLASIVIQQVSDLRRINIEKQHAIDISEAKTRFLASMSHEIRTPINAILGMNEMILRENKDKVIGEYSKSIKTSGKMLLMLVNDVLDFSKIEAGKLEISENRFLMSDMLYDVISLVKERADEKSLELKTKITDEIPDELVSDEFRIRQILVNLINNAVKYTEEGTVTVVLGGAYTEDNGYMLNLCVKDTGKGIPHEDQPYLFEAFSRADMKSNVNIEGTGLGLAIVKSIVESMNGTLGVNSKYGEGSEFWVKLPVEYVSRRPLGNDFMNERPGYDTLQEECSFTAPDAKILAVDDNQSNLTIVRLFLKRSGIKPDLCSSGIQAVDMCREKKYDLILLDHMMPQPDGIETLHIIRNDVTSLNRDTKAVVLTANAVAGSRQMYINEGFEDYLTKPLDSKLLEETVKNFLPADKVIDIPEKTVSTVYEEDDMEGLEF
ncbi:MAG: response regulator, partial [Lachnospiraceae bacterium]|nr:response regulator [Lachnospiraceae bacterium]